MTPGSLFASFQGSRATVLGDLMLDAYIFGTASRISPEAPVMVIRQERTRSVPGGAGNVAANIAALGGAVQVVGVVGDDDEGRVIAAQIGALTGNEPLVAHRADSQTTVKTRIVADHAHQVLRVDRESEDTVPGDVADQLVEGVRASLAAGGVLVLSDYLKGAMTERVVQGAVAAARAKNVPVVANPKPKSARLYAGCQVVTLNRSEASELVGSTVLNRDSAQLAAERLRSELDAECVVVTLGELGLVAATQGGGLLAEAPKVEVADVAGAGDTALAVIALARSVGPLGEAALRLAAEASARVVRHVGVAVPDARDLAELRAL